MHAHVYLPSVDGGFALYTRGRHTKDWHDMSAAIMPYVCTFLLHLLLIRLFGLVWFGMQIPLALND